MSRVRLTLHALWKAIIGFIVGVAVYFAVQLLWWEFFPYKTASVKVPIEIINIDDVRAGRQLELFVFFDKYTDVSPTASRSILCPSGASYVAVPIESSSDRPQGEGQFSLPIFRVPSKAQPEEGCIFQFKLVYQVNPIRTITKTWESEIFTIKE